eukprot:3669703-Lingulodinium_polyedra.AAC.1
MVEPLGGVGGCPLCHGIDAFVPWVASARADVLDAGLRKPRSQHGEESCRSAQALVVKGLLGGPNGQR